MSCTVEERKRARRAARAIPEVVATGSVDVLAPSAGQYGEWTLDAVLCGSGCSARGATRVSPSRVDNATDAVAD